jgi:hypothetical protein
MSRQGVHQPQRSAKRAQIDGRRNLIRRHTIRLSHIDRACRTCRRQRTQSRTMVHTDPLRMSCSQRSKHPRNSCILRSPRKSLPNYNLEQHCTAPGSPRLRSPVRTFDTPGQPSPRNRCILPARYTHLGRCSWLASHKTNYNRLRIAPGRIGRIDRRPIPHCTRTGRRARSVHACCSYPPCK